MAPTTQFFHLMAARPVLREIRREERIISVWPAWTEGRSLAVVLFSIVALAAMCAAVAALIYALQLIAPLVPWSWVRVAIAAIGLILINKLMARLDEPPAVSNWPIVQRWIVLVVVTDRRLILLRSQSRSVRPPLVVAEAFEHSEIQLEKRSRRRFRIIQRHTTGTTIHLEFEPFSKGLGKRCRAALLAIGESQPL